MRTIADSLHAYEHSTLVTPEEESFYGMHRSIIRVGDTTSAIEEISIIREIPAVLFVEPQVDFITHKRSLRFIALRDIHSIAEGRLAEWKEEEHLGEKLLFQEREYRE